MKLTHILFSLLTVITVIIFSVLLIHFPKSMVFKSEEIIVLDGETLELNGIKIKLKGVAAPKLKQQCEVMVDGKLDNYPCGMFASTRLSKIIGKKVTVECTDEGKSKQGVQLSYCYVNDQNLNKKMIEEGFAYAENNFDLYFQSLQYLAKSGKKGFWHSKFEAPWKWEESHKK